VILKHRPPTVRLGGGVGHQKRHEIEPVPRRSARGRGAPSTEGGRSACCSRRTAAARPSPTTSPPLAWRRPRCVRSPTPRPGCDGRRRTSFARPWGGALAAAARR
jgi:hypothetical protein